MARIGVTVEELKGVLDRAGIPIPSFDPKDIATANTEQAITGTLRGEAQARSNPLIENMKKQYMSQINKIAEMDMKLSGVYGDPSSKLFLEHPLQRESLRVGAENVGYNAAKGIMSNIESTQEAFERETEDKIKDTISLYNRILQKSVGTSLGELSELSSIIPGLNLGSLEDILKGSVQQGVRPPIESFDDVKPSIESFDNDELGVDILNQGVA